MEFHVVLYVLWEKITVMLLRLDKVLYVIRRCLIRQFSFYQEGLFYALVRFEFVD